MFTQSFRKILICLSIFAAVSASANAVKGSVVVTYTGTGAAAGLSATAEFSLINSTTLCILLTNTSLAPPEGADSVLSSINFRMGSNVAVTGGSVLLKSGSTVVVNNRGSWVDANFTGDLNKQYGYSNTGIGNGANGAIYSGITQAEVQAMQAESVTSHTNGGNRVRKFSNNSRGLGGGLDFGLVPLAGDSFGRKKFILDGVKLTLNLDNAIPNLAFLTNGTYVEFGSDHAYVGGQFNQSQIPEPMSFALWAGMATAGFGIAQLRRKRRSAHSSN